MIEMYKYQNGNVTVTLGSDGTKIQEWPDNEEPMPIYPNSMDIKITNYCDLGCAWCHEMSTESGKHADLKKLLELLKDLPKGTELAIGGGNPMSHPDLLTFLQELRTLELIPNLTMNYNHLPKYGGMLNFLINQKLVYGVGLSINDDFNQSYLRVFDNPSNIVFHVIAGINNISILDKIKNCSVKKVLVLGYKKVGRGKNYLSEEVKNCLNTWQKQLGTYLGKIHLSFDNLSVKQLSVASYFPNKVWNAIYMGDDGQFTMYIDAVKEKFALSSTSLKKYNIKSNIIDIFSKVRLLSKT